MASIPLAKMPVALRSGADFTLVITVRQNGVPVPVTDVRGEVRDSSDPTGALLIELTDHLVQDIPGVLRLFLAGADTEAYPTGNFFWDLFATLPGGDRTKLVDVSSWKVIGRVTEDPS